MPIIQAESVRRSEDEIDNGGEFNRGRASLNLTLVIGKKELVRDGCWWLLYCSDIH